MKVSRISHVSIYTGLGENCTNFHPIPNPIIAGIGADVAKLVKLTREWNTNSNIIQKWLETRCVSPTGIALHKFCDYSRRGGVYRKSFGARIGNNDILCVGKDTNMSGRTPPKAGFFSGSGMNRAQVLLSRKAKNVPNVHFDLSFAGFDRFYRYRKKDTNRSIDFILYSVIIYKLYASRK